MIQLELPGMITDPAQFFKDQYLCKLINYNIMKPDCNFYSSANPTSETRSASQIERTYGTV